MCLGAKSSCYDVPFTAKMSSSRDNVTRNPVQELAELGVERTGRQGDSALQLPEFSQVEDVPKGWRARFRNTNLYKIVHGSDLAAADVDAVVGSLGVVASLLLTVPFSLMGSLNMAFWDNLAAALKACGPPNTFTAEMVFRTVYEPLNALLYFSMGSILLCVLYYVLRPTAKDADARDKLFASWWSRGRFAFLLLVTFEISAVVCAFTLFNVLVPGQWLVGFSSTICDHSSSPFGVRTDTDKRYMTAVAGGMTPILILVGISIFVML